MSSTFILNSLQKTPIHNFKIGKNSHQLSDAQLFTNITKWVILQRYSFIRIDYIFHMFLMSINFLFICNFKLKL